MIVLAILVGANVALTAAAVMLLLTMHGPRADAAAAATPSDPIDEGFENIMRYGI